jgi:HAD superfamily hydrolase (TIGR01484 family)
MTAPSPILCFDFDGTLVDPEGRIHPEDVEILGSDTTVTLVPATGRPLHSVRTTLRAHGLFAEQPVGFPLILENGAMVYDEDEVLRSRHAFAEDVRDPLLDAMLATPELTFIVHQGDEVRVLHPSEPGDRMIERFRLETVPYDADGGRADPLTKVVCIAATPEPLQAFARETGELPMERAFSLPTALEFNAEGVDKGTGLAAFLEGRADGAPVLVAGDGGNDLPLFPLADVAFAPEESLQAILDLAHRVVDVSERGILRPMLEAIGA